MESPRHPLVNLGISLGWAFLCLVGSSLVGLASHVGATLVMTPGGQRSLAQAQAAGLLAGAALMAVLVGCLVIALVVPSLHAAARRICFLCGALLMSGLPVAMLALLPSSLLFAADLRHWADATGLVAFFLWVRVVTESWRGLLALWRPPSLQAA